MMARLNHYPNISYNVAVDGHESTSGKNDHRIYVVDLCTETEAKEIQIINSFAHVSNSTSNPRHKSETKERNNDTVNECWRAFVVLFVVSIVSCILILPAVLTT